MSQNQWLTGMPSDTWATSITSADSFDWHDGGAHDQDDPTKCPPIHSLAIQDKESIAANFSVNGSGLNDALWLHDGRTPLEYKAYDETGWEITEKLCLDGVKWRLSNTDGLWDAYA